MFRDTGGNVSEVLLKETMTVGRMGAKVYAAKFSRPILPPKLLLPPQCIIFLIQNTI